MDTQIGDLVFSSWRATYKCIFKWTKLLVQSQTLLFSLSRCAHIYIKYCKACKCCQICNIPMIKWDSSDHPPIFRRGPNGCGGNKCVTLSHIIANTGIATLANFKFGAGEENSNNCDDTLCWLHYSIPQDNMFRGISKASLPPGDTTSAVSKARPHNINFYVEDTGTVKIVTSQ